MTQVEQDDGNINILFISTLTWDAEEPAPQHNVAPCTEHMELYCGGCLVLLPLQAGMHQARGEFNQKTKGAYLLMHPHHV